MVVVVFNLGGGGGVGNQGEFVVVGDSSGAKASMSCMQIKAMH